MGINVDFFKSTHSIIYDAESDLLLEKIFVTVTILFPPSIVALISYTYLHHDSAMGVLIKVIMKSPLRSTPPG